jgi:hypothetical protein
MILLKFSLPTKVTRGGNVTKLVRKRGRVEKRNFGLGVVHNDVYGATALLFVQKLF